jgi:hypothetical protein
MRSFDISLFTPPPERAPLVKRTIDARETTLNVTTALPLGFGVATVGLPASSPGPRKGMIPEPLAELRGFAHVEIRAGGTGHLLHEGRVVEISRGPWGDPDGFVSHGYGASAFSDHVFRTDDEATEMTSRDIILRIMGEVAPMLEPAPSDQFSDPGVIHTLAEFDGMRLSEVVDQLAKEGGMDPVVWDFAVWEGLRLHMTPRVPPETPEYVVVPGDASIGGWRETFLDAFGQVTVRYDDHDENPREFATNPDLSFEGEFGVWRTTFIEGGVLSDRGARQFARTWAGVHRRSQHRMSITAPHSGLRRVHGGSTPPHLVRAGQWIRVPKQDLPLIITRTTYDAQAQAAAIELGDGVATQSESFRRIEDLTIKQIRMINAATGGKQRGV